MTYIVRLKPRLCCAILTGTPDARLDRRRGCVKCPKKSPRPSTTQSPGRKCVRLKKTTPLLAARRVAPLIAASSQAAAKTLNTSKAREAGAAVSSAAAE